LVFSIHPKVIAFGLAVEFVFVDITGIGKGIGVGELHAIFF
jgi:hypothetical protein